MGAWGYDALDSDAALDWLGNCVTDHVGMKIRALLNSIDKHGLDGHEEELRAAAHVLVQLNFFTCEHLYGDLWADVTAQMEKLRNDITWIEVWDDEESVRESLNAQLIKLWAGWKPTTLLDSLEAQES
jgi:hypothetical protein